VGANGDKYGTTQYRGASVWARFSLCIRLRRPGESWTEKILYSF